MGACCASPDNDPTDVELDHINPPTSGFDPRKQTILEDEYKTSLKDRRRGLKLIDSELYPDEWNNLNSGIDLDSQDDLLRPEGPDVLRLAEALSARLTSGQTLDRVSDINDKLVRAVVACVNDLQDQIKSVQEFQLSPATAHCCCTSNHGNEESFRRLCRALIEQRTTALRLEKEHLNTHVLNHRTL